MRYLLDTNVLSETRKIAVTPQVTAWLSAVHERQLYVSVLVLGEIRRGIAKLAQHNQARAAELDGWLTTLAHEYEDRILPVDAEVADAWGRLSPATPLPVVDGLLAATAQVHRLVMVTRNTGDFARSGVPLLNPFEPSGQ